MFDKECGYEKGKLESKKGKCSAVKDNEGPKQSNISLYATVKKSKACNCSREYLGSYLEDCGSMDFMFSIGFAYR